MRTMRFRPDGPVLLVERRDQVPPWSIESRLSPPDRSGADRPPTPARTSHAPEMQVWQRDESSPTVAPSARWPRKAGTRFPAVSPFIVKEPAPDHRPSLARIPGGLFSMGDALGDGDPWETPVHDAHVSGFEMHTHPVTQGFWDRVHLWALRHGYDFENPGAGAHPSHPVHSVNWYDAVKWCNALSEMEGLRPCYFTVADQRWVYRCGRALLLRSCVDWTADGYRLPTEAEWECAARGGMPGHRFPWGDAITHVQANYFSVWNEAGPLVTYDRNSTPGYHRDCRPHFGGTTPAGSSVPNAFGLRELAGNVFEFCWDWFAPDWYALPASRLPDPTGPESGEYRVLRGGSWHTGAKEARVAFRARGPMQAATEDRGFRCVRRPRA